MDGGQIEDAWHLPGEWLAPTGSNQPVLNLCSGTGKTNASGLEKNMGVVNFPALPRPAHRQIRRWDARRFACADEEFGNGFVR